MKRMHVHIGVDNLDQSVRFYSALLAAEPTVLKPDYAKWMLDDPRVNLAISTNGGKHGLDHLGIQVESRDELTEVYGRLKSADGPVLDQGKVTCCYAESEKSWIHDPQGVAWETFLTTGEATVYGPGSRAAKSGKAESCCMPAGAMATAGATAGAKQSGGCGCGG